MLFNALARLSIGVAFEAACVRRNPQSGVIEVGLAQRAAKESFAPGAWHFPGTFYRLWESPEDVLNRLIQKEFGELALRQAICVGTFRAAKPDMGRERGHVNSELWLILGAKFGDKVIWYDSENLPEGTFYSHREKFVPGAVEAFQRWEDSNYDARSIPKMDIIKPAVN